MTRRILLPALILFFLLAPFNKLYASDDRVFTTVRLNKFGSVIIKTGQKFGFDISGLVLPFFTQEGNLAGPDHTPTATWKSDFIEFFTPQNYKEDGKHVDWNAQENPIYYTSLYGAILKTDAEHSNHPEPTDCYITQTFQKTPDIPDAPKDFQKAREADGWLGLDPVDANEGGVVDFNLPSKTIGNMDPNADCKRHDLGFEREPVEVDVNKFAQFGSGTQIEGFETTTLFTIIREFVEAIGQWVERKDYAQEQHKDDVILTEKKMIPWYHVGCHDGGCPGNEAGPFSGNSPTTGGYTAFTLREEDKKPMEDASLQPYEISVLGFKQRPFLASYDIRNQSEVRQKQAACYMVPDTTNTSIGDLQAKVAIGGKLAINPECKPIEAKCPIDLIEEGQVKTDSSCKLCNTNAYTATDTYLTPLEKQALPSGIPPLMQKVLEAAGSTYNVPASVLLATMLEEGSFEHPESWKWSDDTVRQWSNCEIRDPFPDCEKFANPSGAKGPFGFIQNWWDQFMESGGPYKAYESDPAWKPVLANLKKENITQCNFVDAAFNAARELGEDASHYQPAYVPPAPLQCTVSGTSYDLNIATLPASCGSWDTARTVLARLQYGDRICEDTGVARVARTFDTMSCG